MNAHLCWHFFQAHWSTFVFASFGHYMTAVTIRRSASDWLHLRMCAFVCVQLYVCKLSELLQCKSYFILYVKLFTVTQRLCRALQHFLINFKHRGIVLFHACISWRYIFLIRVYTNTFCALPFFMQFMTSYILCVAFVRNQKLWRYLCASGKVITWPISVPLLFSLLLHIECMACGFRMVFVNLNIGQYMRLFITKCIVVWWNWNSIKINLDTFFSIIFEN